VVLFNIYGYHKCVLEDAFVVPSKQSMYQYRIVSLCSTRGLKYFDLISSGRVATKDFVSFTLFILKLLSEQKMTLSFGPIFEGTTNASSRTHLWYP